MASRYWVSQYTTPVYYLNGSVEEPFSTNWTNETGLVDGDTSNYAVITYPTDGENIEARGTNAPSSGLSITNLRFRAYGYVTSNCRVNITLQDSAFTTVASFNVSQTSAGWTAWQNETAAPSGGWDWSEVQGLRFIAELVSIGAGTMTARLSKIEIEVTTGPGTSSWSSTSNWSDTSGGAGGASVPSSSDDVYFDANSGDADIGANRTIRSLNTSSAYENTIDIATYKLTIGSSCSVEGGVLTANNSGNDVLVVGSNRSGGSFFFAENTQSLVGDIEIYEGSSELYLSGYWDCYDISYNPTGSYNKNIVFENFYGKIQSWDTWGQSIYFKFNNAYIIFNKGSSKTLNFGNVTDTDGNRFEDLNIMVQQSAFTVYDGVALSGIPSFKSVVICKSTSRLQSVYLDNLYVISDQVTLYQGFIKNLYVGCIDNMHKFFRQNITTTIRPRFIVYSSSTGTLAIQKMLKIQTENFSYSSGDFEFNAVGNNVQMDIRQIEINVGSDVLNLELPEYNVVGKLNINQTGGSINMVNTSTFNVLTKYSNCFIDDYTNWVFTGGTVNVSAENTKGGSYKND